MKKTDTTTTITFTPSDSIIDEEIERAIKPLIPRLRAAAELDDKLTRHRDEASPTIAAEVFDKTYASAVAGDAAAEKQIYSMGPREALVERQQQIYNIREAARAQAARANGDLFTQAGEAALPALARAEVRAQEQHRSILKMLGEAEQNSTGLANAFGWRRHYFTDLGAQCGSGEGARAVIGYAGLTNIIFPEQK